MLMPPPKGDHAARPVSSYSTNRMFGAPAGAFAGRKGSQSGVESRTSSLMVPLKGFFAITALSLKRAVWCSSRGPYSKRSPSPRPLAKGAGSSNFFPSAPAGADRDLSAGCAVTSRDGHTRAHASRPDSRRPHHDGLHRGQRLPRPQGRPHLRLVDPRGGDLDGDPERGQGLVDPREQHRPDRRVGGRHALGDHLRAAGTGDRRLVDGISRSGSRS